MTVRALCIVLLIWTGGISPALAIDMSVRPDAREMSSMPPFCAVRLNAEKGSPEWNAWRDRIGENFLDIHHYCFALTAVKRYWGARSPQDRGFYLQRALDNYDYVVNAIKPDFTLGAELYSDRGALYKIMRKPGEAVRDFNKALSINPKLVRPYLQLADLQAAGKSTSQALETVTEGLRHLPDSTTLQRRYLELGGKKPFPEPLVAQVAEPEPETAASTQVEPVAESAPASEPQSPSEYKPVIGTPSNPYCRFCPAE